MYRYETHLHTAPVSKCGKATVRENLEHYKALGYAGVFITNHFIDGNINISKEHSFEERLRFYFSDYEEAKVIGRELGIAVFNGVEMSYKGTDFLVYGPDLAWYLEHPEIQDMNKSELLPMLMESGALVIQAHPYREARYIDHIRLFPRCVQGVEVYNGCRTDFENEMALHYANAYGLLHFAGTDNHRAGKQAKYGGMESETPIQDEQDFIRRVLDGSMKPFQMEIELEETV